MGMRKGAPDERFRDEVGRKAQRKLRARATEGRNAWFWLGMYGLVGALTPGGGALTRAVGALTRDERRDTRCLPA